MKSWKTVQDGTNGLDIIETESVLIEGTLVASTPDLIAAIEGHHALVAALKLSREILHHMEQCYGLAGVQEDLNKIDSALEQVQEGGESCED